MKILTIIPARGGSKGVPGKNIKLLNGKPLLAYTSEIALQSKHLTEVIVSTENEQIIEVAKSLGIKVPFIRPMALAQDNTPTIDAIIHALHWYENKNIFFDAVCLLQITSPFRTLEFLDKAIEKFIESDCDSLVSVQRVPHEYNPHWVFEPDENGMLQIATGETDIIKRRQELPQAFFRDGAIYLTKIESIKNGTFYGEKLGYIESNPNLYVNIDTMEDWLQAEQIVPTILSLI